MANAVNYALHWDETGEKRFESGVDHVVLYTKTQTDPYGKATAWNGVTGITQSPSGAEPNDVYADNIKYVSLRSAETFGLTITAYQSPEEFDACDGSAALATGVTVGQQVREPFGLCYRTFTGDDANGQEAGYKYHLVYGGTASPSERAYATINDSPEPIEMSWEVTTTPVNVTGFKPTACIEIDSRKVDADKLASFLETLYGTSGSPSTTGRLPLPDEVKAAFT